MNRRYRTVFWVVLLVINCVLASLAFYMIKWGGGDSGEKRIMEKLTGVFGRAGAEDNPIRVVLKNST